MLKKIKPQQWFLIDGIGALITAFMHGVVLVQYQELIGIPIKILYMLACIALVYAVYSISNYYFFSLNWRAFLKIIALLNFLFCSYTFYLILTLNDQLTLLGKIYFSLEIFLVLILVFFEMKSSMNKDSS